MREKIVAANWKMNKDLTEGLQLVSDLVESLKGKKIACEVIMAPPFIHLSGAAERLKETDIVLAAQNIAKEENGAFTGEVSAQMIASTGAKCVIIGHSERRAYYGENGAVLHEKLLRAISEGLRPIFCVGEQLNEREAGKHFDVVSNQLTEAFNAIGADKIAQMIIAYEPVWAIGTGKTASPEIAEEMHAHIRSFLKERYGESVAKKMPILYGGSCNGSNAVSLFSQPNIDGGLIGGASLAVEKFMPIIEAWDQVHK